MFALYVIHRGDTSTLYKIGAHTGNVKCLIRRYITAIPSLRLCIYHPFNNRKDLLITESFMKSKYIEIRQRNINGNLSEWYELDEKLLNEVKIDIENASSKLNTIIIKKEMSNTKEDTKEKKSNEFYITNVNSLVSMVQEERIIKPSYQREVDENRLPPIREYIINNMDRVNFYMPDIVLNRRGDTYRIVDGQHRVYALTKSNEEEKKRLTNINIRCAVMYDLDDEEEKQLFTFINKSVPCPQLYLISTERKDILTKFIIDIKYNFGHNTSPSEKPRVPNFNIKILTEAIVHARRDGTSYLADWYGDRIISNGEDLYNAFLLFNEYLGKKLTGTNGFRVYTLNRPRSADRHDEERFMSLLDLTRSRATHDAIICYLGFIDTERLLRCVFNHGMLY